MHTVVSLAYFCVATFRPTQAFWDKKSSAPLIPWLHGIFYFVVVDPETIGYQPYALVSQSVHELVRVGANRSGSDFGDDMISFPVESEQLPTVGSQGMVDVFRAGAETPFQATSTSAAPTNVAHLHLHNQQFQQNIGISIGLTEDEVHARVNTLENEAERRHHGLMEAMRATAEQNFANAEEEANSVHRQVVASLEATIANYELQSARTVGSLMQELRMRDHHLQSEIEAYKGTRQSLESSEQLREQKSANV